MTLFSISRSKFRFILLVQIILLNTIVDRSSTKLYKGLCPCVLIYKTEIPQNLGISYVYRLLTDFDETLPLGSFANDFKYKKLRITRTKATNRQSFIEIGKELINVPETMFQKVCIKMKPEKVNYFLTPFFSKIAK